MHHNLKIVLKTGFISFILFVVLLFGGVIRAQIDTGQDKSGLPIDDSTRLSNMIAEAQTAARNNPADALLLALQADSLAKVLKNEAARGAAKSVLGDVYMDYNSGLAEQFLFEALEHARKSGEKRLVWSVTNLIAIFYQTTKQNDKALKHFFDLLNDYNAGGNDSLSAGVLNNIALNYRQQGVDDSAVLYLEKAMSINTKYNNIPWLTLNYLNLGLQYLIKEDYDKAMVFLTYGRDLAEKNGYTRTLPIAYNRLANTYFGMGDSRAAIELANKSLKLSRNNLNRFREQEALEVLINVFEKQGRYDSLSFYLKQLSTLRDSIVQQQEKENASSRLRHEELREIIDKKEAVLIQYDTERKERLFLTLIVLLGTALLIMLLVGYILQQRNKLLRHRLAIETALLEKAKLEHEIDYKNRELATHVLAMQKKNESLLRISEELKNVQIDPEGQSEQTIKNIVKNLAKTSEEQLWPEFEKRFKEIHGDFYKSLSIRHPDLTPNELKLCAFMKMNMSTKEISSITSQSPDTIKMARYRLRTKLGLQRSESLTTYLNQL